MSSSWSYAGMTPSGKPCSTYSFGFSIDSSSELDEILSGGLRELRELVQVRARRAVRSGRAEHVAAAAAVLVVDRFAGRRVALGGRAGAGRRSRSRPSPWSRRSRSGSPPGLRRSPGLRPSPRRRRSRRAAIRERRSGRGGARRECTPESSQTNGVMTAAVSRLIAPRREMLIAGVLACTGRRAPRRPRATDRRRAGPPLPDIARRARASSSGTTSGTAATTRSPRTASSTTCRRRSSGTCRSFSPASCSRLSLFASIVEREWGAAGVWPARAFAVLAAGPIFVGTYSYALGLCAGLGALRLLQSDRRWLAVRRGRTHARIQPARFRLPLHRPRRTSPLDPPRGPARCRLRRGTRRDRGGPARGARVLPEQRPVPVPRARARGGADGQRSRRRARPSRPPRRAPRRLLPRLGRSEHR